MTEAFACCPCSCDMPLRQFRWAQQHTLTHDCALHLSMAPTGCKALCLGLLCTSPKALCLGLLHLPNAYF